MSRRIAALLALVALLLPASGCDQPLVDKGEKATPTHKPAVEGTGPEPPAKKTKDKFYVKTADLPPGLVGGNNNTADIEDRDCLYIKWLGPDIPENFTVEVTKVHFVEHPDVPLEADWFSAKPFDGCRDRLCEDGYSFTADNYKPGQCRVPVTAAEPGAPVDQEKSGTSAYLEMSGNVRCPTSEMRLCQYFLDSIKTAMNKSGASVVVYYFPNSPPTNPAETAETTQPVDPGNAGPPAGGGGG